MILPTAQKISGRTAFVTRIAVAVLGVGLAVFGAAGCDSARAQAVVPVPGKTFRDCAGGDCAHSPEMVVVPAGKFLRGSPVDEPGRMTEIDEEGPRTEVTIAKPFAAGRSHVTRGEFAAFVKATGHKTSDACYIWTGDAWNISDGQRSWQAPGFEQNNSHSVVCVNWQDAKAYAKWLSATTGKNYRLMSETEAEYIARATTAPNPQQPRYFFGNSEAELCGYANGADETARAARPDWQPANADGYPPVGPMVPCNDGFVYTAPIAHFKPNAFGVYDTLGNVWTWTADNWNNTYESAPTDGSARTTGDGIRRVIRGGAWDVNHLSLRAASRKANTLDMRLANTGFRLARELE